MKLFKLKHCNISLQIALFHILLDRRFKAFRNKVLENKVIASGKYPELNILRCKDPIVNYIEDPLLLYALEKLLTLSGLLDEQHWHLSSAAGKSKQVLAGVILIMERHRMFRPNYMGKSFKSEKLSRKVMYRIMGCRWQVQRIDHIKLSEENLISLALSRVTGLRQLFEKPLLRPAS